MRSADDPELLVKRRSICFYFRIQPWARIQVLIFALVLLLAGACIGAQAFAQSLQSENQSNTVHGIVVNAVTHDPVGRALVYSGDNRYATLTDGEGHFEFTLPKDDHNSIFLMARKPGFLDDPNERRPVEMSLMAEMTLSLMPEGLIKGRVTSSAADPANRVDVLLFSREVQEGSPRWVQKNTAYTNSNGEFRFAELQPGTYKVLTSEWMDNDPVTAVPGGQLYGFPPVYYPGAVDFAEASTIQLTAGQIFQADLSLVRQPYYLVKIPVTNSEETGGINITVSLQGQRGPGYSLSYNQRRQMIEGQLPNGKYLVEAATYGQNSATGSVNLTVAGAPAEGPAMVIARSNAINVNVKEEFSSTEGPRFGTWSDGKHTFSLHGPRLDINISAVSMDDFGAQRSGSIRQPMGPNDDLLVLENLAPGRYWLRLHAARGYVASATMGGVDLLREPLVVVPGANASIDITMRDDSAELEGTLIGVPAPTLDSARPSPVGYVYCIPLP
ncbi:MAG: carboxypeptidase-like regulatory domain-containing protein, partial [Candidatus Sulfotelmatobacter sp.]